MYLRGVGEVNLPLAYVFRHISLLDANVLDDTTGGFIFLESNHVQAFSRSLQGRQGLFPSHGRGGTFPP